ncbi:hypothetical protein [Leucobacter sp. Psy1]|uniref:hypothetical protein n=1 Tax=Leucobacter sp. Psy1 TaxID=2875729 RepID=UPI001CD1C049|nr:hypothetical protein [Leucobacter sp. Psy1]
MPVSTGTSVGAVVFDLGNVLVGWDPHRPLADRLDEREWHEFAEASDFAALNAMADRGVPLREVVRRATEQHPRYGDLVGQ